MNVFLPGFPEPVLPSKIICIGRNYAEHVREMGDEPGPPEEPVVFLKPPSALIGHKQAIILPPESADVHHELEIVVAIGKRGRRVSESEAADFVAGYALGIDVTARDLQKQAKDRRAAWSIAKGIDTFAPVGTFVPAADVRDPQNLELALFINGERRQFGNTRDMLFTVPQLISYVSRFFTLEPGDLLFTGTPEGVGPLQDGDELVARATGLPTLELTVRRDTQ
ncbi:fumarylacetoacetate hydrolase family protein [soil metagenome]